MSISSEIRRLSAEGLAVAEIAEKLNIRYQHAYGVLNKRPRAATTKPPLPTETLVSAGFTKYSTWISNSGELALSNNLPKEEGVYAFSKGDLVQYVGIATVGIAARFAHYIKPGRTMTTSIRIRQIILDTVSEGIPVDIYVAFPPTTEWNGLPVHSASGLEVGLIRTFALPWNIRGA